MDWGKIIAIMPQSFRIYTATELLSLKPRPLNLEIT